MDLKQSILLLENSLEVPKFRYRLQRKQKYYKPEEYLILMERLQ